MSIFWNERNKRCFAQHATSYSTSEEKKEVREMLPIILPGAKFQCELFAVQVSVPYTLRALTLVRTNSLLPWLIRNWLILIHFSPSPSNIHRELRGCPCQRKTRVSEHSLVTTWVTISRNSSRDLMLDAENVARFHCRTFLIEWTFHFWSKHVCRASIMAALNIEKNCWFSVSRDSK